jgi:putative zinc finger protein
MPQLVMHRFGLSVVTTSDHLSATDIAAFIDHSLPLAARARAELHLSGCDRCREELASCARLAGNVPVPRRRRMTWPLIGLTAAALIVAVVLRPTGNRIDRGSTRERTSVNASARIVTVFPAPDAAVRRSDLRFVWHRDDRSSGYRVIITDTAGAPLWTEDTEDTADTSSLPPLTLRLHGGSRYFWRVETLHTDGSAARSVETPFRIPPE